MPGSVEVHRDDSATIFFGLFFWPEDLLQNLKGLKMVDYGYFTLFPSKICAKHPKTK
jgi:hypothetical protein